MAGDKETLKEFTLSHGQRVAKSILDLIFAAFYAVAFDYIVRGALGALRIPVTDHAGKTLTEITDDLLMCGFGLFVVKTVIIDITERAVEGIGEVKHLITLVSLDEKDANDDRAE